MRKLELLDYGRLAAAFSVVAFHYFFNEISNGKISSITHIPSLISFAKYGYLGVEFFFMISGYVIFFLLIIKQLDNLQPPVPLESFLRFGQQFYLHRLQLNSLGRTTCL